MKSLLLNNDMEPLAFISDRRAMRLLFKEKVEVICGWADVNYYSAHGFIELPAVIRLKYRITRNAIKRAFSRGAVFKRDGFCCQYCSRSLSTKQITLDHIIPVSKGGVSSFDNCVASCGECNIRKGAKLLHEIGMKLLKKPETPEGYLVVSSHLDEWHKMWDIFIRNN